MKGTRKYIAEYYDAFTTQTDDIDFYAGFVTSRTAVLELGCGSGRVTAGLANKAGSIVGIDISETMLERARKRQDVDPGVFTTGDITSTRLGRIFDLVIAPYRVLQVFEHPAQVDGFFEVIKAHLAPEGLAILNVFDPLYSREEMPLLWPKEGETPCGEVVLPGGVTRWGHSGDDRCAQSRGC